MTTAYLVVPCYNEEAVLPETVKRLTEKLRGPNRLRPGGEDSRILLVDDGSKDRHLGADRRVPPGKPPGFRPQAGPQPGGIRTPCWPV